MSRRRFRPLVTLVASVLLAAAAVWLRQAEHDTHRGKPNAHRPPATPNISWTELSHASLPGDPADDGDSFVIRHSLGQNVLRLYFIDCPEKRRHQYNRERLAEQGAAFGGLTEADTLRVGRKARDFTLQLLQQRPFRIFTRWEPVYDDRRHYAHLMVTLANGQERSLAELLVEAGLARIHTRGTDLPDGTRRAAFEHRLRTLEKSARLAGRGGWAELAQQNAAREE
ncbi:MAG: thermonuclease family protein [Verrucomicrobiales bacterium]